MNLCLAGLVAAVRCTSLLGMGMLRGTFVTTVARFTQLHAPASMAPKHAQAFRALLVIADENGNHLGVRAAWSQRAPQQNLNPREQGLKHPQTPSEPLQEEAWGQ